MTNPKVRCNWRNILDSQFELGDILVHNRPCLRGPILSFEIIRRQGEAVDQVEFVQITAGWLARKDPTDLLNEDVPWVYHEGKKLVLEFPNNSTLWGYELIYPHDSDSNIPAKIKIGNCMIFIGEKGQLDPNLVEGFPT